MKKKLIVVMLAMFMVGATGCADDKDESTEVKVPESAKELKKENYEDVETRLKKAGFKHIAFKKEADLVTGWVTKEGDVEKVSIEGITDFEANDVFEKDAKVIITYHVFPEESSEEKKEESTASSSAEKVKETQETTKESSQVKLEEKEKVTESKKEENITIDNNEEFAHIINDSSDYEAYKKFAEKYVGKTIEFDANIAYMNLHANKKTRFDFLIYGGDYRTDGSTGAPFQIRDKNIVSDLNLTGDNIPDSISEGLNIRLTAEVDKYDSRGDLFLINPIETKIR